MSAKRLTHLLERREEQARFAHPIRKERVRAVAPLRPSPGPVSSLVTDGVRPQDALFLSFLSLFTPHFTLKLSSFF